MPEGGLEIPGDARPDLLGLQVIGVVIAGRQHIGADHDAARDLGPEALRAGRLVHPGQAAAVRRDAQAIAHPVIAGEIGGGLGRGDNIVSRQRIFGHRQADVLNLGPRAFKPADPLLPQVLDFPGHAVDHVFLWYSDLEALYRLLQRRFVIRHRGIDRS